MHSMSPPHTHRNLHPPLHPHLHPPQDAKDILDPALVREYEARRRHARDGGVTEPADPDEPQHAFGTPWGLAPFASAEWLEARSAQWRQLALGKKVRRGGPITTERTDRTCFVALQSTATGVRLSLALARRAAAPPPLGSTKRPPSRPKKAPSEAPRAKKQAVLAYHELEVIVPEGCLPRQQVRVQAPCGLLAVTIPEGLGPGQRFRVRVPVAAPMPMAAPTPVAAPARQPGCSAVAAPHGAVPLGGAPHTAALHAAAAAQAAHATAHATAHAAAHAAVQSAAVQSAASQASCGQMAGASPAWRFPSAGMPAGVPVGRAPVQSYLQQPGQQPGGCHCYGAAGHAAHSCPSVVRDRVVVAPPPPPPRVAMAPPPLQAAVAAAAATQAFPARHPPQTTRPAFADNRGHVVSASMAPQQQQQLAPQMQQMQQMQMQMQMQMQTMQTKQERR